MNKENEKFDVLVAKCGRTIGLSGALKLILYTDFNDFFRENIQLKCENKILTIESFNKNNNAVKFKEINSIDSARELNSTMLYATKKSTKNICNLENEEYFWFDIIGCCIIEDGLLLGEVIDINRIGKIDYLIIKIDSNINSRFNSKVKQFMIPYIDKYILDVKISQKLINTMHAIHLLEAS